MFQLKDLTGQRFGRLEVIEQAGRSKSKHIMWLCRCDCGKRKVVMGNHLTSGRTKSCGCFMDEARVTNNTTHGLSNTNIYNAWRAMKARCTQPNQKSYPNYGGRGIKVFDEWMDSFESYYGYVSKLPHFGEKGYTLDRIDNDGNYEPGNVHWATRKEQAQNRNTQNRYTKLKGEA